jgi:hypothetical protein
MPVAPGRKQGFNLVSMECTSPPAGPTCYTPVGAIHPGCSDVYGAGTACQWVDVTGLAAGSYRLRVVADPDGTVPEANEANNEATIMVTIPAP